MVLNKVLEVIGGPVRKPWVGVSRKNKDKFITGRLSDLDIGGHINAEVSSLRKHRNYFIISEWAAIHYNIPHYKLKGQSVFS